MSNNLTQQPGESCGTDIPQTLIFNGENWVDPPSGSTSGTSGSHGNTQSFLPRYYSFYSF